ncbi:MAG: Qat anti-phage system QueC-like protein QatC [Pirellulaceae bacterium]
MKAVRHVGPKGCDDKVYTDALTAIDVGVIDTLPNGNVTLRFKRDGQPLLVRMSQTARDLVDVAVMVYITDEMEARRKAPDHWTRFQKFLIPVADCSSWQAVTPLLSTCLKRVSGDNFQFNWLERKAIRIKKHRAQLPRDMDAVCLFSGGIDSLMGAYQLLKGGKKVILVGHQADNVTASAQSELARQLSAMFPRQLTLVQCRVARSRAEETSYPLAKKVEETHRCRSFLFLSLAAAVAATAKVSELYIPENGLIALNSPLQKSRLGSLSTRTAHPQFLTEFADVVASLGIFDGALRNPFLYQSKTDMLRGLPVELIPLIKRSVSCSRASRYKNLKVLHCGYCMPCIYRRAAMIECGLDDPNQYAFDSFTHLRDMKPYQRADFRDLIQFADRAIVASPMDLEMTVLSHGCFSPEVGARIGPYATPDYSPWANMIRSWANDFRLKMQTACSSETRKIVGLTTNNMVPST